MSERNPVTPEQVAHIAHLARLNLNETQIEGMRSDLNRILDYVDSLQALDLTEVEPTVHGSASETPLRNDEVRPSLPVESVLSAAPSHESDSFRVPKVVG